MIPSSSAQPASLKKPKITWDEEVIAEHDKERGTRQKIDEPMTPYNHYVPADDDDEATSESRRRSSFTSPPTHPLPELKSPGSSAKAGAGADATLSVFDNWERVNAKLELHLQEQETQGGVPSSSSSSSRGDGRGGTEMDVEDEAMAPAVDTGSTSVLRKDASRWAQPAAPATTATAAAPCPAAADQPAPEASPDAGECDVFKAKRAAHYNEFKLSEFILPSPPPRVLHVSPLSHDKEF